LIFLCVVSAVKVYRNQRWNALNTNPTRRVEGSAMDALPLVTLVLLVVAMVYLWSYIISTVIVTHVLPLVVLAYAAALQQRNREDAAKLK
jgi:hypothetical protein